MSFMLIFASEPQKTHVMKHFYLSILAALTITSCATQELKSPSADLTNLAPAIEATRVSKQEMLDLFLKYIAVESGSQEAPEGEYAMTQGQMEMARMLAADAKACGAEVYMSEWGYVYVDIPSNIGVDVPVLGISAHLDYTPEAPGIGIKPTVITYDGGDIQLANGDVISPDSAEGVDLTGLTGKTIIHSSGETLLGGDDKCGLSITMSLLRTITQENVMHGRIQIVWAPNEDIGGAAWKIDSEYFHPDILFDVDGGGGNEVAAANFSARKVRVRFFGQDAHPSEAKARHYGDALAAAATYLSSTPLKFRPEHSEGLEGYLHPFLLEQVEDSLGNKLPDYVVESRLRFFEASQEKAFDKHIEKALAKVKKEFPYVGVEIIVDETQYDNVAKTMHPSSYRVIQRAAARCNQNLHFVAERAGTTASMFAAEGLVGGMCIYSGQHLMHSRHEYACLEEMMDAYELLLHIVDEVARLN